MRDERKVRPRLYSLYTERHSTKAETRSRISHLLNPDSFEQKKKALSSPRRRPIHTFEHQRGKGANEIAPAL